MHTKTVDVIIPTHRPGHILFELLKRLAAQDCPPAHVMIVNTEEEYWDPAFEEAYPEMRVRHIDKASFDHGGTRHMMALASDADLILFMTQDALPADRHLTAYLAEQFENEDVRIAAAYARQIPRLDSSVLERCTRQFNYPAESRIKTKEDMGTLGIKTFFCSNVCAMYDRKIYLEQGGFPKHTIFNEDMIFARGLIDAGYGIAYVAETRVIHSHNYSGRQQFHRNFDVAVSQAQHPEVFKDAPSEGEGFRLVRKVAGRLCRTGKPWMIAPLIWQSACKYMGYALGKRYRLLPEALVRRMSLNADYWKKQEEPGRNTGDAVN